MPALTGDRQPTLGDVGDGKVGGRQREPGDHSVLIERVAVGLLGWSSWQHRWIPSDESDVFELSSPGRAPRILKVEREGMWCVRREELAFPALRARGFDEFPDVEFATVSMDSPPSPFMLMPKTEGRPWPELWAEDRRLAVWVAEKIGDFLRRLADVDWREIPGVVTPSERVHGFSAWFVQFFAPLLEDPALTEADRNRIDELLDAMRKPPAAFGGWQFAQALTDGRTTFVAIDWGNLGAYWRLHDLAAAIGSLDDFGADASAPLRPHLLDAYTNGKGFSSDEEALLRMWLDLWGFFDRAGKLHNRS